MIKGVRREEEGGEAGGWGCGEDGAVQVKEIRDGAGAGGEAAMQLATLGLSPRHCQPDNGLISLPFTPV